METKIYEAEKKSIIKIGTKKGIQKMCIKGEELSKICSTGKWFIYNLNHYFK